MAWRANRAGWAWTAVLLAALGLVAAIRMGSGWANRPMTSLASDHQGLVAGDPAGPDAKAHRLQILAKEIGHLRQRLAALQTDTAARRREVATLTEMLASDHLTQSPAFLRRHTTVSALQQIIREAQDARVTETGDSPGRLGTAAAVARERLRNRLEGLRTELLEEVAGLAAEATVLRKELRRREAEQNRLGRQVPPARPG